MGVSTLKGRIFFGGPAVHLGSVALRHQIALVLPLSEICMHMSLIYNMTPLLLELTKKPSNNRAVASAAHFILIAEASIKHLEFGPAVL